MSLQLSILNHLFKQLTPGLEEQKIIDYFLLCGKRKYESIDIKKQLELSLRDIDLPKKLVQMKLNYKF